LITTVAGDVSAGAELDGAEAAPEEPPDVGD
jgi:hypothetical protein